MKILITGSSGFLGSEIVNQLSSNSITELNSRFGDYICDLSRSIPSFQNSFNIVIHNAGKAHIIPKTDEQKEDFFNVNVVGTKNLLKGLETNIPEKIVFISSASVYGLDSGININEEMDLVATDPYGLSKIQAEEIVLDWCNKNKVICTILRLPLLVGNNPPGNLGAMIKGIKNGYYFNIGNGRAKKSMVLVEDVARSIVDVAKIGGIYNLTDGYHPSFAELSNHISFELAKNKPKNIPIWIAKILAKFGDKLGNISPINTKNLNKITSDLTFDDSKARKAFGWNPTPVLDGFRIITE